MAGMEKELVMSDRAKAIAAMTVVGAVGIGLIGGFHHFSVKYWIAPILISQWVLNMAVLIWHARKVKASKDLSAESPESHPATKTS